jgi:hypothetical protein
MRNSSIADPAELERLIARLMRLEAEAERQWGTLTSNEMLCHLGDATDSVLGHRRTPDYRVNPRRRPVLKWLLLRTAFPWPRGVRTRAGIDPKKEGTRPSEFERDRARVIAGLRELATRSENLSPSHGIMGQVTAEEWRIWAWRHTDYHLRQFGR